MLLNWCACRVIQHGTGDETDVDGVIVLIMTPFGTVVSMTTVEL